MAKGILRAAFDKGQIAARIGDFWKVDQFAVIER
jgi:hypothetical protein